MIKMNSKELSGCKICEALSDPTRIKILKFLISKYPLPQTISEIEKNLERKVSATTISFHLRKLREAGLVTTNGHKKGFKATNKSIKVEFNGEGMRIKEEK
ncbi:hypothetical protein DRO54_08380 [Candidatus Bathyarchaeota archaeon]|nr:MAG: hypothetical protein DRO54_08380 [Candidatus Bathyarchaeota archaeon]